MISRLTSKLPKYIETLSIIHRWANEKQVKHHINDYVKTFEKHPQKQFTFETSWASHLHKLRPHLYADDLKRGKVTRDLFETHCRQNEMMYHVTKKLNAASDFEGMVKDYEKFLRLFRYNNEILVPSKNIDLVWHLHLDDHHGYIKDVLKICGRFIDHNDVLKPEILSDGLKQTEQIWQNEYHQPMIAASAIAAAALITAQPPTNQQQKTNESGSSCGGGGIDATDYFLYNQIMQTTSPSTGIGSCSGVVGSLSDGDSTGSVSASNSDSSDSSSGSSSSCGSGSSCGSSCGGGGGCGGGGCGG